MAETPHGRSAQPEVLYGRDSVAAAIAALSRTERAPVLVMDAALADTDLDEVVSVVSRRMFGDQVPLCRLPARSDVEAVQRVRELLRRHPHHPVVALGGGAVLDTVKLATLIPDTGSGWATALCGACGASSPPAAWGRRASLVTVPTTVGTSSEVSPSAVLEGRPGWRWLIQGRALVPTTAVIDPVAFASLPRWMVAEGAVEAALRLLVPYVVGPTDVPGADDQALAQLAALGTELAALFRPEDRGRGAPAQPSAQADAAARVALLGGQAHSSWALAGRSRYAHPLWCVANELAALSGWRKVPATLALLPAWVELVEGGRPGLGDPARLRRAADALGWPAFTDPAALSRNLVQHVPVPSAPGPTAPGRPSVDAVLDRLEARWRGRFPMLSGIDAGDLRQLVSSALTPAARLAG